MKDSSSEIPAKMIFILLSFFSLQLQSTEALATEAMNCIISTGFNLQCPRLANSVCLEIIPMTSNVNATTPYDLLCDGTNDCILTGADEGHPELSPSLMCNARTFQCFGSRETIPLEALCNGTAECIDGVDEINALCANKCFGSYQGGCLLLNRVCGESRALSRDCGDCLEGFYQVPGVEACQAIPLIAAWENSTIQLESNSTDLTFEVCFTAEIDTSVQLGTTLPSLGDRIVSLDYTTTSGGTNLDTSTIQVTNATLGQTCVPFMPGFRAGVIEDDQMFTVQLQDLQTPSEVQFPSGQTATVQVLERETFTLTTSSGSLNSDLVAYEGDIVEICFATTSIITRSPLEIGVQVVSSATDATINDDFQLPGSSTAILSIINSQFCFNVTIVNDNEYDGPVPEQLTLVPFSVSTPDLIQLPLPNVTIYIQDNDTIVPFLRSVNDTSATEGSNVVFELVLQGQLEENLTVTYQINFIDGTATRMGDFSYSPYTGSVVFTGDGLMERAVQFTVSFTDDMIVEGNETFTVTLVDTMDTIEFTIIDTSIASVSFEQASYTISVSSENIILGVVVNGTIQTSITFEPSITGITGVRSSGSVTLPGMGTVYVTLYFDNITMTGLDQMFYVDLVQTDIESGVNIQTTPSSITLQPIEVTISFNETAVTVVEGMMVTVVLNIDTGILVGNITLMLTDGTTSMMDYSLPSSLVATQTADPSLYTFTLTIIDDDLYEGNETFTLLVVDPPGFENYTKFITIQDNEELTIQVTEMQYSAVESSSFVTVGLTLTPPADGLAIPVTFTISFRDITATGGGEDYDSSEITVAIAPQISSFTAYANATITDDSFVEATETFSLLVTCTQPLALSVASITSAMVQIMDDDVAIISFEQPSYTASVSSNNITLGIVVYGTLQVNITLETNITGIEGVRSSGPVTLTGMGTVYVTLYFDNITMTGLDQVFYVDLAQTDIGSSVNIQTTPSSINLQPIEVTVSFNETAVTVVEGMMVTVVLNIDTGIQVGNITLMLTDGTTSMMDYSLPSSLVASQTADPSVYTFTLTIIDDDLYEGNEIFTLSVVDPPGFENYTKFITIQDNEELTIQVTEMQYSAVESSSFVTVGLTLIPPADGLAIPVTFTISFRDITATGGGEDYDSSEITVAIAPQLSSFTAYANATITDDSFVETTETFSLLVACTQPLALSVASITSAMVQIMDDDVAIISFEQPSYTASVSSNNITLGIVVYGTLQVNITLETNITGIEGVRSSGPVTLTGMGTVYVTLYFDNITMTGLDQVFYVDLAQTDIGSSVNIQTTPSSINLQPIEVTVSFNETAVTVVEGMMVTVVLNIDTGILVGNITLMLTDGTTSMMDYSLPSSLVASQTADPSVYTFALTIIDDDLYEGDETFTLSVVDPPGFENYTKFITIQDNEELTIQVTEMQYSAVESSSFVTVGLTLTPPADGLAIPVTFTISFRDITATGGGEDYDSSEITVAIGPQMSSFTAYANATITDDSFVETTETFSLLVACTQPLALSVASITSAMVQIMDDDVAIISFEQPSYTASVSSNNITLGIVVYGTLQVNITLETNITGIEGVRSSGPVTLTGMGTVYVTLYFDNITMTGLDQMFYVDLVQTDIGSSVNIQTTPSSITLQPIEVAVSFNETAVTVVEGMMVTVVLNIDTGILVGNITLMLTDGTTSMMDYSLPSSLVASQTADPSVHTFTLMIIDDDSYEGEEYFTLSVVDPPGLENYTISITIEDNEELTVQLTQQELSTRESSSAVTFGFTVTPPAGGLAIPVTLMTSYQDISTIGGLDYDDDSALLRIPPTPMQFSSYISLNITNDDVAETLETFTLTINSTAILSYASITTATVEIQDDDELTIAFEQLGYTVYESDGTISVNVSVTSAGGWAVPLQFSIVAQDYTATSGTDYIHDMSFVNISSQYPDSSSSFTLMIQIVDDDILEVTERFTISLQLLTAINLTDDSNVMATIYILDEEAPISVGFEQSEYTVYEGTTVALALDINRGPGGNQSLSLFNPERDLQVVRLDGTAVPYCEDAGSGSASGSAIGSGSGDEGDGGVKNSSGVCEDYCFMGILGETVYFYIKDDNLVEGNEMFSIMLVLNTNTSQVIISNGTINVVIADDDNLVVTFTEDSYTVQESNDTVAVCVIVTEGQLETTGLAEVMVSAIETSNATESEDYRPLNGTTFIFNSTNQDEMQCLYISDYIIDDQVVEFTEDFNLSLSVFQTSFPIGQLIFYRSTTQIFIEDDDTTDVSLGDDPHFSVVLPSKKMLCFSVQGEHGFNYNLISNKLLVMNAKFVPDSRREEVTWIGSLGLVIHGSSYGVDNKTFIKLESRPPSVSINTNVKLHPHDIELITVINGKLMVSEAEPAVGFKYPSVKFSVAGIIFSVVFKREHLDMFWHSTQQHTENSHGLIGQFFHKGVVIDEVRKILIMPNKEPVPVMRRPVWSFMERETTDDQLCWTAMNPGYQGEGLIDGTHSDYIVKDIISPTFRFNSNTNIL